MKSLGPLAWVTAVSEDKVGEDGFEGHTKDVPQQLLSRFVFSVAFYNIRDICLHCKIRQTRHAILKVVICRNSITE